MSVVDPMIGDGAEPAGAIPGRPDLSGHARHGTLRWWPAIAVFAVIVVVVFGGYVLAAALSVPAGPPVGFAGAVSIRPLSGWEVAGQGRVPIAAGGRELVAPFLRLTRGSGTLDLTLVEGVGADPEELAGLYRDGVLASELGQLSVSDRLEPVRLASGATGVRFAYVGVRRDTGASVEGEVTALTTPSGTGIVFDGFGPEGLLAFVRSDIQTMIDQAEIPQ